MRAPHDMTWIDGGCRGNKFLVRYLKVVYILYVGVSHKDEGCFFVSSCTKTKSTGLCKMGMKNNDR